MTIEEFIKAVNDKRLAKSHGWYSGRYEVNGKIVLIKGYQTWLQILNVDGVEHSGGTALKVNKFKEQLREAVI